MTESAEFAIPDRRVFKATEVCQIAKVQPYVLRSWESEFPDLGVARTPGGARVYRRSDVERVLRIRQLVYDEGLTLAGVRRRLEDSGLAAPPSDGLSEEALQTLLSDDARQRVGRVRDGLRGLLRLLESRESPATSDFALAAPADGGGGREPDGAPVRKRRTGGRSVRSRASEAPASGR